MNSARASASATSRSRKSASRSATADEEDLSGHLAARDAADRSPARAPLRRAELGHPGETLDRAQGRIERRLRVSESDDLACRPRRPTPLGAEATLSLSVVVV